MKQKRMLYLLIASSILMFISMFVMNYKVLGLGLLQWVVLVFIAFYSVWKDKFKVAEFAGHLSAEIDNSIADKKYAKAGFYAIIAPMMAVGMLMVVVIIVCMIFVF